MYKQNFSFYKFAFFKLAQCHELTKYLNQNDVTISAFPCRGVQYLPVPITIVLLLYMHPPILTLYPHNPLIYLALATKRTTFPLALIAFAGMRSAFPSSNANFNLVKLRPPKFRLSMVN